ncbi:MAG: EamA family transporter [Ardenticatenaceae bacterium]|nr:EamA family transporter [Ardenticatenaceae bacterium]HBY97276.1 4-amino-4-deoxy-L-arabinose transferase [Chloroflexota bacterium]
MTNYLPLIFSGVALNAAAQLFLRQGMRALGTFEIDPANLVVMLPQVALNPWVLAGLACYVLSVGLWLVVLSRVEVSYAYPMVSIGYILTLVLARIFFQEAVTPVRVAGVVVIMLGVFLVARS